MCLLIWGNQGCGAEVSGASDFSNRIMRTESDGTTNLERMARKGHSKGKTFEERLE